MKSSELLAGLGVGFKSEEVLVPGWPEPVVVRELGALEAVRWKATLPPGGVDREPGENLRAAAHLVVLTVYQADGQRLFQPVDVEQVANLPDAVLTLLTKAATRVNGLDAEALARAEQDFGRAPT